MRGTDNSPPSRKKKSRVNQYCTPQTKGFIKKAKDSTGGEWGSKATYQNVRKGKSRESKKNTEPNDDLKKKGAPF